MGWSCTEPGSHARKVSRLRLALASSSQEGFYLCQLVTSREGVTDLWVKEALLFSSSNQKDSALSPQPLWYV